MKKIVIILLSFLTLTAYAKSDIRYIDEKNGYYVVYLSESNLNVQLSTNIGKIVGYSSEIIVTKKDGYYSFYSPSGRWKGYVSISRSGEAVSVKGETLVTKKDGYLITWSANGRKISEVSAR